MAQKAGVTTEEFSRLAYAANLSGVGTEGLKNAFKTLNEQIVAANQGSPDTLQLFRDLNVTGRTSAEVLAQVATRFADTADGADKSTAAVKLFGKAGMDMIPFLNQGADGIRQLLEESDAFGQTISNSASKNAEEFNDNLTRMKSIIQGVVNAVVTEMLPSMAEWSAWIIKVIKENGVIQGSVNTLIDTFKVFAYTIEVVVSALKAMWNALNLVGDFIGSAVSAWLDGIKVFADAFGTLSFAVEELIKGHFSNAKTAFKETVDGIQIDFANFKSGLKEVGKGVKADWDTLWNDLAKGPTAPLLFQGPSIGAPNVEPVAPIKQQLTLNTNQEVNTTRDTRDSDKAFMLELEMQAQIKDGIGQMMAEEALRYQQRLLQIGKLNIAEEDSMKLAQLAAQAHAKAASKLSLEVSQGISGIFGNMAAAAQAFGKKGFSAFKAFASAQALVNTYSSAVGAYNAMASIPFVGPALAVAAAAAAIAAGLANVAQINSTQPPGQAHAGATYIPQESTYFLQQGERVLAPKQNEDLTSFLSGQTASSAPAGGNVTYVVQVEGRELFRLIHDASRNGNLTIDPRAIREGI